VGVRVGVKVGVGVRHERGQRCCSRD
jgi:hypothetical protein